MSVTNIKSEPVQGISQKQVERSHKLHAGKQDSPAELKKACRQFEEILLRMVLKEAHIDRSLGNESDRAGLYGDVVIESLAKSVASGGGLGVAEILYHQLSPKHGPASDALMKQSKTDNADDQNSTIAR